MADLTDLQAAGTTKIVGSSPTGLETNAAKVSATQDVGVADVLDNSGVQGAITVGTSAVAARVGGSNLTDRKIIIITNTSTNLLNSDIYWGLTNAVTTATGTPIVKGGQIPIPAGPNTTIWLISASTGNNTRIVEMA